MNLPLWFRRLQYRFGKKQKYCIRYRGKTSVDLWSFPEAMKLMRVLPVRETLEVLLPNGQVHFTLPSRKEVK